MLSQIKSLLREVVISVPLCCVQSFSPNWESVGEALSGHNEDSQLAAPALQAAKCCQLPSARREGEAGPALLHPWGGAGRKMQASGDESA